MFGKWGITDNHYLLANTIYWSNFCIIIISVFALSGIFIGKLKINLGLKIYFLSLYITFLFFYSYFNKLYPYFYTQDYRYLATTLILTPIFTLFLFEQTKNKFQKNTICILTIIFCISSFFININP